VGKPAIYHCISRVVDRRFAFGPTDKEKLRAFLRMQENFSGCRVLAYCLMCNHIHLLLEVPPMPADGIPDAEFLRRLKALYAHAFVEEVAKELKQAREVGNDAHVAEIHARYAYRMHDLSEFMKGWLQRFTQWFNRTHKRTGGLWEDKFKSVIVEDGCAAKTMAAYIDLNPVRAGMAKDPAEYRWSSYGEAMGGGAKGNGKKARAGLVRALRAHRGCGADATHWSGDVELEYRMILLEAGRELVEERIAKGGAMETGRLRNGMTREHAERERRAVGQAARGDVDMMVAKLVRRRVRYFVDGVVIGSRGFVDEVFSGCRGRFGPKRKTGARKLRGAASAASGVLWSLRDLKSPI
jgi:REP element-mobilizing transposase RayT